MPDPVALAALHALAFRNPRPWAAAEFAALLADPLVFLLEEPEALLMGRAVAGEAELLTLATAPQARRRGLGRRLVARFLYQARVRGAERAFLEVAADNAPAIALYESVGFARSGLRRGYYGGTDALVMARDLPPPETRPLA